MDKDLIKQTENLSRTDFVRHCRDWLENDPDLAHEAIRLRCEEDFELFCEIFFKHYIQEPFNQFHLDTFEYYKHNQTGIRRVDGAPRGYAKSTIKALFKPIHDVCYGREKYILFISATQDQALGKLKDIRREILTNDFLVDVYGVRFPHKKPGAKIFEILTEGNSILLQAVSSGTEIRGIRYGQYRPTKIVLDDVEDSEEVLNEEIREKNKNWFFEVVSNLGSKRTNIEIVGTVLHRKSLLMELSKNPAYTSKIYKAVLSWADRQDLWDAWTQLYTNLDNEDRLLESDAFYNANEKAMLVGSQVLWPERESYHSLMKELIEKGRRAFMKEKQNHPLPGGEVLFENIHWYREDPNRGGLVIESNGAFIPYRDLAAYGAMDPAVGETKSKSKGKLDYTCLVGGYKDLKGRLFVHKDWTKKARPTRYIREIFEHHAIMDFNKFAIETNLYRGLLLENIQRERKFLEGERKKSGVKDWGIKVPFYQIDNREKKEKRIFTLEPKVNHGWILFNRTLSMDFMDMIEQFPSSDHDDAPDALEMLWGLINNRYKPSPIDINVIGSN